ncbi:hypothetical protein [Actinokineospora sp. NBRC 105648]|uniref:hypothetical protein n=1 Tax=Actinokineospora sp. NBRC 105648 TaxID=3032206 RepID=UPI0024A34340|nr:hypothetical protein [Actinokineospora sp. NBRC 105648]GLZ38344.1 hypothetical protein Acsp05_19680 [Actinokineospora sp. NBRC 105648]
MRRAVVLTALLLGCVACQGGASSDTGGSVDQQLNQIESTLDNVESDLAGD